MERMGHSGTVALKHSHAVRKEAANGKLLQHRALGAALCDNLEGWEGWEGSGGFRGRGHIFWLLHIAIWQQPTQYCKAILLQLKINLKK